jgi:MFS family permease
VAQNDRLGRWRETAVVGVMALGFGLVGIDRFLITTMFPTIAHDLHLNYADIGVITGALAIAWGIAALLVGNLADRIGRRRVLTGSLIAFSLLIGASGLATALAGLVLVRVVMGFADGAYTPASITATLEAAPPERHGLSIGVQQMMLPLCGLGLSPLLVAVLLKVIDWRHVFIVFVIPGLLLAYAVWRVVPDTRRTVAGGTDASAWRNWRTVLRVRNVRIASLMMLCWLTCLITTSAFLPNYFLDYLHLSFSGMTTVMSAIGLGSTAGTLLLPWLSDRVGRRPIMTLSAIGALGGLATLAGANASVGVLFAALFMTHFFNNALITLTVGPICVESVPAAVHATASGLVIAVGELFGGGIAPVLVGRVAQEFGLGRVFALPIVALACGIVLTRLLIETRPAGR